ncbi:MAG: hypothetical protein HY824_16350 [Acidobacteria bacterium]|nr:hypothetical protein [Acidobacteriota bacterium]
MARRIVMMAVLVAAAAASTVWAHDGHAHLIMGTVTTRDDRHIEVKTPGGEVLNIAVTAKTAVRRDKRKLVLGDVQAGHRVVVDIGNGEDPLVAREIRVGATRLDEK